jgi:hypothetical protein
MLLPRPRFVCDFDPASEVGKRRLVNAMTAEEEADPEHISLCPGCFQAVTPGRPHPPLKCETCHADTEPVFLPREGELTGMEEEADGALFCHDCLMEAKRLARRRGYASRAHGGAAVTEQGGAK